MNKQIKMVNYLVLICWMIFYSHQNLFAQKDTVIRKKPSQEKKTIQYSLLLSSGSSSKKIGVNQIKSEDQDNGEKDERVYTPNSRYVTGIDFSSEYFSLAFNLMGDFKENKENTVNSSQKDLIYQTHWKSFYFSALHYEYYGFYLENEELNPDEDMYEKYTNLKNIGNEINLFYFTNKDYIRRGFTFFSPKLQSTWSSMFGLKYFNSSTRASKNIAPLKIKDSNQSKLLQVEQEGLIPAMGITGTYVNNDFFIMGMMSVGIMGVQRVETNLNNEPKLINDFYSSDIIVDLGGIFSSSRDGFMITQSTTSYDITKNLEFDHRYVSTRFYYRYFFKFYTGKLNGND